MSKTPLELGFRMPAEWERHEATWLSWPKNPLTFPEKIIDQVEHAYVQMIEALAGGEKVKVLVDDAKTEARVRSMLSMRGGNVQFCVIKSADVWIRDYGPIFIKNTLNGIRAITKWHFNAWGSKYDDLLGDDKVGVKISESTGLRIFQPDMVLEGGSIDTNGNGLCLTTIQCLLNPNRNPKHSKDSIEKYLREYLGLSSIIWLGRGIEGDDTDGHVDDLARFVSQDTVVCMVESDTTDANYVPLQENYETLTEWRSSSGESLTVLPLEMPRALTSDGDEEVEEGRLPASYANFYIGNEAVLLPVFGDRNDDKAVSLLKQAFRTRKIVAIDCKSLVYGFGGIHCVTQQEPA